MTDECRLYLFGCDRLHISRLADDKMVRFWRIDEDYPVQVAPLSNGLCCAFSTDGSVLAGGTRDGSVYFWATPRQIPSFQHFSRMSIQSDAHPTSPGAASSSQRVGVSLLLYLEDSAFPTSRDGQSTLPTNLKIY